MSITDFSVTDKGLEQIDRIFWKLLGSPELLEQAKRAGIRLVIEPSARDFLLDRYGEKAAEALAAVGGIKPCESCGKLALGHPVPSDER